MRKLTLDGAPSAQPSEDDQAEAENQMRQALGLPSSLPRREKERTGPGVTVEHRVSRHTPHLNVNRLQLAEEALAAEQAAHQQTTRTLRTVQEQLLEANTKRGHSDLARDEAFEARTRTEGALALERDARETLERELETLRGELARMTNARGEAASRHEALGHEAGRGGAAHDQGGEASDEPVRRRRVARPATEAEPNDGEEPVQWWVPGWRRSAG